MANIKEKPHRRQTICELHRRMYRELVKRDPNDPLIRLLEKAFVMAKRMGNKLTQYSERYDGQWYETHKSDGGDIGSKGTT
jgi:hypothetical protein